MPKVKLTDAAVQKYKAGPGVRVEYFDILLPGFALRVAGPTKRTSEVRKTWVIFYRHEGVQKRLTLPKPYPKLALADARRQAAAAFELVSRGIDPGAAPVKEAVVEAQAKPTFGDVAEAYLSGGMKGRKGRPLAARYVEETRRNIENHALPAWRERPLDAITRRDVIALLDRVAEVSDPQDPPPPNGRQKGGPIAANRVLAALRSTFNWAIRRDLVQANPCALVEPPGQETERERTLSAEEIVAVWCALVAAAYPFGSYLQVLLLTGQRRTEVAGMRWDEIDKATRDWAIPADRTKSKREHMVPLSPQVSAILDNIPRKSIVVDGKTRPSPFVFTTDGTRPISGFSKFKKALDLSIAEALKQSGSDPIPPWRLHDLRRTCGTGMGRLRVGSFIIGRVLNHAAKGVTDRVYDKWEYLEEKRAALRAWGDDLARLVSPPVPQATSGSRSGINRSRKRPN